MAYFLIVSRGGTEDMLKTLKEEGVPFLVLSAGLGDSISAVLKYHKVPPISVHIIANFKFNGNNVNGFWGDIIHPFNKNEQSIEKSTFK
jgi:hypothetical protein